MGQPEKDIENAVLAYLESRGAYVWKAGHSALPGRATRNRYHRKGVADILGAYRGRPIAVEVKTPIGKLSIEQRVFLDEYHAAGALVAVVRSLDDMAAVMDTWAEERAV